MIQEDGSDDPCGRCITDQFLRDFDDYVWVHDVDGEGRMNSKEASGVDLCGADLRGANLRGEDLCHADLHGAILQYANLRGANLHDADLHGADLRGANLHGADLSHADLHDTVLRYADLHDADLCHADLRGAILQYANLRGANLHDAKLPAFQLPEGDLVVYGKKNGVVVNLLVKDNWRRTACLVNRNCRCERAMVLSVKNSKHEVIVFNKYGTTVYKQGEIVEPDSYDDDIRIDCSHGIHFFLTRREAEEWK